MLVEFSHIFLFFLVVLLTSLFTAFVRVLAQKWGFIEWGEINLPEKLAELVSCNFCSAFWLASIVGLILFFITVGEIPGSELYILLGVFVAPISRLLA